MTPARSNRRAPLRTHETTVAEVPTVVAAPGLLEQPYEVIREDHDTDESYEERKSLVALLVRVAKAS